VATYAEIFRANQDFYAKHAEFLFEHRFGLYDELSYWRGRYGELDAFLSRHRWLQKIAKWLKKALLFIRSMRTRKANMASKIILVTMLISALPMAGCGHNEAGAPTRASGNAVAASAASAAGATTTPVPKGVVTPLDSGVLANAQSTGVACSLDTIDGNHSKDLLTLDRSRPLVFRGWLLDEAKQPAGEFSLVLKGTQDYAISASTGEMRKDVGEYFKDPALSAAGFSVSADLSVVQRGSYSLVLVIRKPGRVFFCDTERRVSLD